MVAAIQDRRRFATRSTITPYRLSTTIARCWSMSTSTASLSFRLRGYRRAWSACRARRKAVVLGRGRNRAEPGAQRRQSHGAVAVEDCVAVFGREGPHPDEQVAARLRRFAVAIRPGQLFVTG